jgi:hypothetical protein
MKSPLRAPSGRLEGVATPAPALPVDSRPCAHCRRPISRPPAKQKACSPRCRWALWKTARQGQEQARQAVDRRLAELLREALSLLEEGQK